MNYSEYSFVFDIDGTICPIRKKKEKYEDLVPYASVVKKVHFYHETGARIVFFTSRNMNSYGGNLSLINKNTARIPAEWLDKWNVLYDEIFYGKSWPGHKGFYVDNRLVRPDEFLIYTPEEFAERCETPRAKEDRA